MTDGPRAVDARLAEAAIKINGEPWVNMTRAARIVGVPPTIIWRWKDRGLVRYIRVAVPKRAGRPAGVRIGIHLDDLIARVKKYRRAKKWTDADDEYLCEKLGRIPIRSIAANMGRTPRSVYIRMVRSGLNVRTAQGKLTTGDIAGLLDVGLATVQWWINRTQEPRLAHTKTAGKRFYYQVEYRDVIKFLDAYPKAARRIDPKRIAFVRSMAYPKGQKRAKKQVQGVQARRPPLARPDLRQQGGDAVRPTAPDPR